MIVDDKELCQLNKDRHNLMREREKRVITKSEFNKRMAPIQSRINQLVKQIIDKEDEKIRTEEVQKMTEQTESAPAEKKKPGRKISPDTFASVIAKVLMQKGIKNIDDAVKKVGELKPGRDEAKTKTQIKTVIRLVKNGKGRWAKYTWNPETFLLTENEN